MPAAMIMITLSARPFHKAPQILFPDLGNPFPSNVEGFKLALSDPVVNAPPGTPSTWQISLVVYMRSLESTLIGYCLTGEVPYFFHAYEHLSSPLLSISYGKIALPHRGRT